MLNFKWMHYIVDKLLLLHYAPAGMSKEFKEQRKQVEEFKERVLGYKSAISLLSDPYVKGRIEFVK